MTSAAKPTCSPASKGEQYACHAGWGCLRHQGQSVPCTACNFPGCHHTCVTVQSLPPQAKPGWSPAAASARAAFQKSQLTQAGGTTSPDSQHLTQLVDFAHKHHDQAFCCLSLTDIGRWMPGLVQPLLAPLVITGPHHRDGQLTFNQLKSFAAYVATSGSDSASADAGKSVVHRHLWPG